MKKPAHETGITGIVLAGGKSRRLGIDKAWIEWQGMPLIQRAIGILKEFCDTILVSANGENFDTLDCTVVRDRLEDGGPMAGLFECLLRSESELNLVLAVDTPMVTPGLYQYLLEQDLSADVLVARDDQNYYQPLCAVYNKSILPVMQQQIKNGVFGFTALFEKAECISVQIDPSLPFYTSSLFLNINTPEDLEGLRELSQNDPGKSLPAG